MIKLENIKKKYNDSVVLNNINIDFKENKIYIIKGISGSGKTTLLNIIGGIDYKYEGNYFYLNKSVKNFNKKNKKTFISNIGYMYQNSFLIRDLSIYDNLRLINNDNKLIDYLSKVFDVKKLLYKMPSELSGGERQRISLIRLLLKSPKIIIADEPTSSLDFKNSYEIVKYISKLRNKNNVIIISTHSNIFDQIADEIIYLEYGSIKKHIICDKNKYELNRETNINFIDIDKKTIKNKKSGFIDFKYSYIKFRKKSNFISIFALGLIVFLLLLALSLKYNFKNQLELYQSRKYPFDTIYISKTEYEKLEKQNIQKIYYDYYLSSDNVDYYGLLPFDKTIISNKKYLKYGYFPKKSNEVLVNFEYYKQKLKNSKNFLGTNIYLNGIKFEIVGVITDDENLLDDIYSTNYYYKNDELCKVFIPYEKIKTIPNIEIIQTDYLMITLRNLDNKMIDYLNSIDSNCWQEKTNNIIFTTDIFLKVFFASLFLIILLSFLFVSSQIIIELIYRKREFGYLQLFGITKKRLYKMIYIEYALKYFYGFIFGIITYSFILVLIKISLDLNFSIKLWLVVLVALIYYLYSVLLILLPINRILKKDIKELIMNTF